MDIAVTIGKIDADVRDVNLRIDNGVAVSGRFEFNRDGQSLQKSFADLRSASCSRDSIFGIGEALFRGVFPSALNSALFGAIKGRNQEQRKEKIRFRLELPPDDLRTLPWEALAGGTNLGCLGILPNWSFHQEPSPDDPELMQFPGPPDNVLKVLIVVPLGTGLNFTPECDAIKQKIDRLDEHGHCEVMPGAVSVQDLRAKLAEKDWDIVHYIGHGIPDERCGLKIMLKPDE